MTAVLEAVASTPQAGEPWHLARFYTPPKRVVRQNGPNRAARRALRFARRRMVWKVSNLKRANGKPAAPIYCGRVAIGNMVEVVRVADVHTGDAVAHVEGLQTCGSVWACPVCSANIRDGRARELEGLIGQHLEQGGGLFFLTLTLRHNLGDDLAAGIEAANLAWNRAASQSKSAKTWKKRLGWLGAVRALEITYGENGWHPHLHVLVFTETPVTDDLLDGYSAWLGERWADRCEFLTGKRPSAKHGLDVQRITSGLEAGKYLVKVQDGLTGQREVKIQHEMLRGDMKEARWKGLNPFQLLDVVEFGSDVEQMRATRLWHEYEHATKGRRFLTGMTPLLSLYALDQATDEALAETDPVDELLDAFDEEMEPEIVEQRWSMHANLWGNLCRAGMDAHYLEAVELGGREAGEAVMRFGVPRRTLLEV